MSGAAISPQIRVRAFPLFASAPINLPHELIYSVESTRSLTGGSIALQFSPGHVHSSKALKSLSEILTDGTVVQLLVRRTGNQPWQQLNVGMVDELGSSASAGGTLSWSPVIRCPVDRLREQELFIDAPEPAAVGTPGGVTTSSMTKGAMSRLWIDFAAAFQKTDSLPALLQGLWDHLVVDMLHPQSIDGTPIVYGGQRLLEKGNAGGPLVRFIAPSSGYTDGFFHVFSALNQNRFGGKLNLFQMLSGLCSPPFYELFFDPLEGDGFLGEGQTYHVTAGSSALVFRRTPFDDYWQSDGGWQGNPPSVDLSGARFDVAANSLYQITNRTVPGDLYTGVHVGTSAFERGGGNLLMFAATWSPQLFARYGHRPMLVRLEGLSPSQSAGGEANLKTALMQMQSRLYTLFLGGSGGTVPLRNTAVTLEALFDFYRTGTVLRFPQIDPDFGGTGYVSSVTDRFDLHARRATSTISLKWVDRHWDYAQTGTTGH